MLIDASFVLRSPKECFRVKTKLFPLLIPALSASVVLTSCGQSDEPQQSATGSGVTVTNCSKEVIYAQTDNLFVNDANIISMVLSVGAADKIRYVGSVQAAGGRNGAEGIEDTCVRALKNLVLFRRRMYSLCCSFLKPLLVRTS
ncbi:hypothetical protein FRC0190_00603 [Corynebacterium rouxii]|uniref:Uncharacterized protein n=1 Tax=Corynebacterium rouxii TaxID=2719119 RepID=A0A6I8MG48_9CORY|nr:hypothetical protein FRC0190_00603 [Corynebacterium rouxii]